MEQFKEGDINDPDFQRHIIDLLVNKIFLFDEPDGLKLTITYNLTKEAPTELRLSDIKSSDYFLMVRHNYSYPNFFIIRMTFGLTIEHYQ